VGGRLSSFSALATHRQGGVEVVVLNVSIDLANPFPSNYLELPNSSTGWISPSAYSRFGCSLMVGTLTWNKSAIYGLVERKAKADF